MIVLRDPGMLQDPTEEERRFLAELKQFLKGWTTLGSGGHFAAMEQPEVLAHEIGEYSGRCAAGDPGGRRRQRRRGGPAARDGRPARGPGRGQRSSHRRLSAGGGYGWPVCRPGVREIFDRDGLPGLDALPAIGPGVAGAIGEILSDGALGAG